MEWRNMYEDLMVFFLLLPCQNETLDDVFWCYAGWTINPQKPATNVLMMNSSVGWSLTGHRKLVILHEKLLKRIRIIKRSKQSRTVSAPHRLTGDNVTWWDFCPINLQLFSHLTCRNATSQNLNFSKILQNATILQFKPGVNKEALFKSASLLSDPGHGTKQGQTSHYPPADITVATTSFSSKTPLSVLSPKKRGRGHDLSEPRWVQGNLLLTAGMLWIVTIFACVRQLNAFSESTTRQWPLFTLLQDYQHNEMHCYGFQRLSVYWMN